MQTLGDIVSSVLSNADNSIKIASDADAAPEGGVDNFDEILGITETTPEPEPAPEPEVEDKTASDEDILADAAYAMKLASALDRAGEVVSSKLAMGSPVDAPGPQVFQSEHQEASTHPTAVTTSVPGPQKSHGGGGTENTANAPNGIETNKKDFSTPDWTKNKEAALELLTAKTAQAEQFLHAGEIETAEALLSEVEEIQNKLAADPSSPQAKLPKGKGGAGKLDTEPGPSSHIGDNSALISMTRASAKDSTTREATKFFSEQPKKDNAVAAHVGKTDGLKVSSLLDAVEKHAGQVAEAPEDSPADEKEEAKEASAPSPVPLEGEKLAAAKAYLQKQASLINDPNATADQKKVAADIINTVKAKLGNEQVDALLA